MLRFLRKMRSFVGGLDSHQLGSNFVAPVLFAGDSGVLSRSVRVGVTNLVDYLRDGPDRTRIQSVCDPQIVEAQKAR